QFRGFARLCDEARHRPDRWHYDIAPGGLKGGDKVFVGCEPQVLIRQQRNRVPMTVIGCEKLDSVKRALDKECGQGGDKTDAKARSDESECDLICATMRDQAVCGKNSLVPLLHSQSVLRAEMELDATVKNANDFIRSLVEIFQGAEIDRARNREDVWVMNHWHLTKANAGLRHRAGRDQA